jgi:hypothetical protein
MSAFVVSPTHIDVLLSVAMHGPSDRAVAGNLGWTPPYVNELLSEKSGPLPLELCSNAGTALLAECLASVSYRYPDLGAGELPGPLPTPVAGQYEFTDFGSCATIAETCKAIDCLEYQSCEHPTWSGSGAERFCTRLREELTAALPGAVDAPWEWSPETLAERGLIPVGLADIDPKETCDGR